MPITDEKSLKTWLEGRPRADAWAIAIRAALRALPIWETGVDQAVVRSPNLTALSIVRLCLVTGLGQREHFRSIGGLTAAAESAKEVTGKSVSHYPAHAIIFAYGEDEVQAALYAIDSAAAAANLANSSPNGREFLWGEDIAPLANGELYHSYVSQFGKALEVQDHARFGMWSAIDRDAQLIESGVDLISTPLWTSPRPGWFAWADDVTRAIWAADPPGRWDFWIRWWDGILAGKPLDWDLQRDVALIPDADWQQGPDHIARLIAEMELDHAIAATPNAEGIDRDAIGLFFAVPVIAGPPNPFRNAKEKVADTVTEIRAKLTHNAISIILDDLARLEDHLHRYAENPLRIHDVFEKTIRHINGKLATTELSREDLVDDLLQDLDSGAIDIRRSDKEVARTVKARGSERLKRLKAAERARYDGAMAEASAEARDDLRAEIANDLAVVAAPAKTEAEATDCDEASFSLISRGTRMAKRKKDDLVKMADEAGKIEKGVQAAGKVVESAPGWWEVIANTVGGFFS